MGWQPNYQTEARIYANYIKKNMPDAKVAILYQNDDYGKDYLQGMKDGLGDMASKMIVAEESYEVTEPTIDSQIIKRSEEHTSELQSLMRISYAVFCLKKKKSN